MFLDYKKLELEKLYPISEFLKLGSKSSIYRELSCLIKAEKLSRVTRGIYARLRKNSYLGEIPPDVFEIAKIVSKEAILQISGAVDEN